jgi:hypothetical protein
MTNRACDFLPLCESNCKADPDRIGFKRGKTLTGAALVQPKKKGGKGKKRKGAAKLEDK